MPLNIRDTFPLTHRQAVQSLVQANWTKEELAQLSSLDFVQLDGTLGVALRTHWYLTERTFPLAKHYNVEFGLGLADDMSRLILKEFVAAVQGQPFCVQQEALNLKKHWLDQGVDPLTLDRLP